MDTQSCATCSHYLAGSKLWGDCTKGWADQCPPKPAKTQHRDNGVNCPGFKLRVIDDSSDIDGRRTEREERRATEKPD